MTTSESDRDEGFREVQFDGMPRLDDVRERNIDEWSIPGDHPGLVRALKAGQRFILFEGTRCPIPVGDWLFVAGIGYQVTHVFKPTGYVGPFGFTFISIDRGDPRERAMRNDDDE